MIFFMGSKERNNGKTSYQGELPKGKIGKSPFFRLIEAKIYYH
jgi:hypothetical protein